VRTTKPAFSQAYPQHAYNNLSQGPSRSIASYPIHKDQYPSIPSYTIQKTSEI
jgi:hypothetical protein